MILNNLSIITAPCDMSEIYKIFMHESATLFSRQCVIHRPMPIRREREELS